MKSLIVLFALIMLLAAPAHAEVTYTLDENYGNVPVTFVPNVGQFDDSVVFAAEGNNGGVFNDDEGLIFELAPEAVKLWPTVPPGTAYDYKTYLQFRDANANPEVTFEDQAPWNNNYFIGNDKSQWHTDVPNYRTVRFSEIYPGVDLCMTGEGRVIVSSIIVEPHGDPSQIYFPGGGSRTVDEDGNLCVEFYRDPEIASSRSYVYEPPACVQYIDGEERVISLKYQYVEAPVNDFLTFDIGEYDPAHELIIKPGPVYSPLMWVKSTTEVNDIAIDDEDCVYVAGGAEYIFPTTGNAVMDALFAMKLNEEGDELGYVTYFGGSIYTGSVSSCDINGEGNLYVAGSNISNDFPSTSGAYDTIIESGGKSYILKMNKMGNDIIQSTYLGGRKYDDISALCIDHNGDIYLTGSTNSPDFPVTDNAFDNRFTSDVAVEFVTKMNSNLTDIIFSTFIDDANFEDIAIDLSENIYLTGVGGTSVPITDGAFDTEHNGKGDVIILKLSSDGSSLLYSTYAGGSEKDRGKAIGVDVFGRATITGYTYSSDFPTKLSILSSVHKGDRDAFALKLNEDGTDIIFSGYLGGSHYDTVYDINIDNNNTNYILGTTDSGDYPLSENPIKDTFEGRDSFVTIINEDGSDILLSTYFYGTGILKAVTTDSRLIMMGTGGSYNFPNSFLESGYFVSKLLIEESNAVAQEISCQDTDINMCCFPNPFNSTISISFYLSHDSEVTIDIYNITGQKVDEICSEYLPTGYHQKTWNGVNASSGLYFIKCNTNGKFTTNKILLMK